MELLIVEKNGWSKPVKINRAITRIGSASSNDIQLQSAEIASVHLQILYSTNSASSCKVVNLAHEITARVSREIRQLPPYAAVDIRDGDEILFDDYSITFRLPLSADVMQSATMIDASLSFADAVLRPGFATTGLLTIKNAGKRSACQFMVDLNGLPADCFQIDPIPLMYSGAEEEVRIRIFHRVLYPLAGLQKLVLKVSAPESYPGEELIIQQGIYIAPVFKHTLELVDDLSAAAKLQEQAKTSDAVAAEHLHQQQPTHVAVIESVGTQPDINESGDSKFMPVAIPAARPLEDIFSNSPMQQEIYERPAPKKAAPDISKLKIMRAPVDDEEDAVLISAAVPASVPLEEVVSDPPMQQEILERPAQRESAPDISKLRIMRPPVDDDEDAALISAEVSASAPLEDVVSNPSTQQEVVERSAPKKTTPVISRPVPDISKLKVMRAPVDYIDDDAAPAAAIVENAEVKPVVQQELPDRPAQKQSNAAAPQPVLDVSKMKVVQGRADADNFWDEKR